MYLKLAPLLFLSLVNGILLDESRENEFVVSTTQRPSQQQQHDDRLAEIEDKLANNSDVLEAMNLQIEQIQMSLNDIKLNNQLQSAETKHCLESLKFQNQTTQKTLANNKEIQKMLEDIKFTNHRILEKINSRDQVQPKQNLPRNCLEVKNRGSHDSNVYKIQPHHNSNSFNVWCDMETKGGGWTYLLNRYDGSQNFDLNWYDYKNGFGNLANEHWLGLEHLYQLTADEVNELLIELVDWNEQKVTVRYTSFSVGNENEGYQIKVINGFDGDVHDDFSFDQGIKFSTKDKDQDPKSDYNCAAERIGGWWYNGWCSDAKLTGLYGQESIESDTGIYWWAINKKDGSLKKVKMMIKPRN